MSKVTWNDLKNATPSELKKTYKLNDRQLENQVRKHMDGANHAERRGLYETVWANKKQDNEMSLNKGAKPGTKKFGENIATEIKAGKPKNQAIAIAYSEAKTKKKGKKK